MIGLEVKVNKQNKTHTTMKKTIITLTIILGLSTTSFADGGLFQRGYNAKNGQSGYLYFNAKDAVREDVAAPLLPPHGSVDNEPAPLGGGFAIMTILGAAYLIGKRLNET